MSAESHSWKDSEQDQTADADEVTAAEQRDDLLWLRQGLGSILFFLTAILVGGAVFWAIEDSSDFTYRTSCWFSMTLFTTIGYGTFAPTTSGGKVWLVIFAMLTIPPTPVCLNYISNMMINICARPFRKSSPAGGSISHTTRLVILLMGLLMHLLICGGVAFSQIEDWSYGDSVYYSFVTLTTIGLGDFAPASQAGQWWSVFFVLFGLGIVSLLVEDMIALFQEEALPQVEEMAEVVTETVVKDLMAV